MNARRFQAQVAALGAALISVMAPPAQAVTLSVVPSTISQFMTTALVNHGHTVIASTNMNRLEAGGSFNISCMSPHTGNISGERSLPAAYLVGPLQLYVTVPAQLPARRSMPGFENESRGAIIQCTYDWTAFSREGSYAIGIPGITLPVGGGGMTLRDSISFQMRKPGTATGNDDACIP